MYIQVHEPYLSIIKIMYIAGMHITISMWYTCISHRLNSTPCFKQCWSIWTHLIRMTILMTSSNKLCIVLLVNISELVFVVSELAALITVKALTCVYILYMCQCMVGTDEYLYLVLI